MFVLAVGVVLVVGYFLWTASRRTTDLAGDSSGLFVRWGLAGPGLILLVVLAVSVTTSARVQRLAGDEDLRIEVVGHQWWWEMRYPQLGIVTANEAHIPVGEQVTFEVSSDDVIHSFWIPPLGGKIDMIPGRTNEITLEADRAGTYTGRCAEFCGLQHAKMLFVVIAHDSTEGFEEWAAEQREPAAATSTASEQMGEQVFLGSACVYCHTVEGTAASGKIGPDLTHLAGRTTLAAGQVPNTRGNLAGWILDPQSIKPGNKMPPTNLDGPELQALLDYLENLD